ncbi:MAG: SDR family oxidoreductase [Flavobacteriales bacterium]|nr:SDR family oxidoreductase [Flavobacteriales bacterium]
MKDKVVIITGASSGIGKATAIQFAQRGAKLVIAARSADKLDETQHEIEAIGGEVLSVRCDVSIEKDCENLIAQTIERFHSIDVLVNNAGISMRALFNESELKVIKNVMDINFWGTVYCTKFALAYLLKSKGSVVGVSSIAGYVGLPARTGYSASKFAIHGFLEALRSENLENDLHVLIACPGFTASNIRNSALMADGSSQGESPRIESKMMSAEEVAEHIYKSIQNRSQKLVLTTEGKLAVFLSKWAPEILQKMVFKKMKRETDSPLK